MKLFYFFISLLFLLSVASLTFAGPTLLLSPLPLKNGDMEKTTDLLRHLQKLFEKENWKVVGMSDTTHAKTLAAALEIAQEEQFNFNNKRAIEIIHQALDAIDQSSPSLADLQKMADAQLFLAYCYKNEGQTDLMNRALNEAARFNPSLAPNEVLFPPSLIQSFEIVKDHIWAQGHFGTLMIESTPAGAAVFINGTFKGKTPLRIDRYPVGIHHLYLQTGGTSAYKKIEIEEGNNSNLKLRLLGLKGKSALSESPFQTSSKTFSPTNSKGQKIWLQQRAKEMHQTQAIGIGLIPKKSEAMVVIATNQGKYFVLKVSESTSNNVLAGMIAEKLK